MVTDKCSKCGFDQNPEDDIDSDCPSEYCFNCYIETIAELGVEYFSGRLGPKGLEELVKMLTNEYYKTSKD